MAQQFSTTFSPGPDPGDPGSSSASGSLHGACFSLSSVLVPGRGWGQAHCGLFFFKKYFIYLFMTDTQTGRERGRDTGRGRSRLHAGSLMRNSIPGLQDHALGQRQALNHCATQGSPLSRFKYFLASPRLTKSQQIWYIFGGRLLELV